MSDKMIKVGDIVRVNTEKHLELTLWQPRHLPASSASELNVFKSNQVAIVIQCQCFDESIFVLMLLTSAGFQGNVYFDNVMKI